MLIKNILSTVRSLFTQASAVKSPPSNRAIFLEKRDFLLRHLDHYERAYAGFSWPYFEKFNWALDYFDPMAQGNERPALQIISDTPTTISFDKMRRRSNQVANFLVSKGVQPFDRILLMLPNVPSLWESTLAAIKIPAVIIPTSTLLTREEISYRLKEGAIQHVITSIAEIEKFPHSARLKNRIVVDGETNGWQSYQESHSYSDEQYQPRVESNANDPLLQYFTSGTTSEPKLVTHTHQSYTIGHLSTMYWLGVEPNKLHLNISSAGWGKHAWSSFFAPWNAEATVVSYGYPRFDIDLMLSILTQHPITSLCAPPTVWRMLRQQPLTNYVTHLEQALSAGEPLNPDVIADVKNAWRLTIREGYGQTETTALLGWCRNQSVIPGTMGQPLPGYQLALVNEQGDPVDEGELAILCNPKPTGVMTGYSDTKKTKRAMRGGLYRTGDILARSENSFFFIGRDDDVFKANGGYRISPFELESILVSHPSVLEAAVVPSPDPVKGMVPKAFIVLRSDFESNEQLKSNIADFLKEKIAPSHMIHKIEFYTELPKTSSGKIRRVELKKKEEIACMTSDNHISPKR